MKTLSHLSPSEPLALGSSPPRAGLGQGAEDEMPRFNPKASSTATHSLAKKLNQLTAEHIASWREKAPLKTRKASAKG